LIDTATVRKTSVFNKPTLNSRAVTLLSRNVPIRVSQTSEEWTEVVQPVRGWTRTNTLEDKSEPNIASGVKWSLRKTSCEVALRQGPCTSAESLSVIPCGANVECDTKSEGKNWVVARTSV